GSITAPATGGVSSIQQFSYNSNGDIVTITDGEGRRVVMQYDSNGNQTLQRDEAGNTVTRTFDSGNRLLTETAYLTPDPDGADPTHT
ncbi:RHS repeat domain-containing protein, partial [Escherichia coli]|uniref:RHS repeat domain-containing protein n=1 Tax=Escherichia coli TaxID=562 RepID=UPI000CBD977D